jgi:NAD+ diphosphatase
VTLPTSPAPAADPETKTFQSARLPTSAPTLVFLGIDDRPSPTSASATPAKIDPKKPEGVPYFAVAVPAEGATEGGMEGLKARNEFVEPRLAGSSLSPWEANIFAEARALIGA